MGEIRVLGEIVIKIEGIEESGHVHEGLRDNRQSGEKEIAFVRSFQERDKVGIFCFGGLMFQSQMPWDFCADIVAK